MMKYIDEFRDKHLIVKIAKRIREAVDPSRTYNFMEVCGTHTMSIFRFGLRDLLLKNIRLISGPGCPVCVTPNEYIDKAIAAAELPNVIIATFGDLFRVPGSYSSLEKEKAAGRDIRMVYSSTDAIELAKKHPDKEVVFLGIGFETTIPTVAMSILMAKKEKLNNYSVLSGHKTMPEVLRALVTDRSVKVDGFILPGHVSAIIGVKPYQFLAKTYKKRCVITGFEPLDILQGILMLVSQKKPKVDVQYTRIIEASGNRRAEASIEKVFQKTISNWRGIGEVRNSGLKIRKAFSAFDAEDKFNIRPRPSREHAGCVCGEVLKGVKTPLECRLFSKVCNPEHPVGACMVATEGTCAAYYKYRGQGPGARGQEKTW
jgi:hydrogenase expression/formation protein HypD